MFAHDTHKNWSFRIHFFAYAHKTQPMSHLHVSLGEINFQRPPSTPLNFELSPSRTKFRECTAQYSFDLQPHSQYQPTVLSPLFHSILLKLISISFLLLKNHFFKFINQFTNTQ